jgi:hypothetical protein
VLAASVPPNGHHEFVGQEVGPVLREGPPHAGPEALRRDRGDLGQKAVIMSAIERTQEQLLASGVTDVIGQDRVRRRDNRVGATLKRAWADRAVWVEERRHGQADARYGGARTGASLTTSTMWSRLSRASVLEFLWSAGWRFSSIRLPSI